MINHDPNQTLSQRPLACIVLAAGLGTRMRSALPKVLHPIAGQPMIRHVLTACEELHPEKIVVVVSPHNEKEIAPVVAPYACALQQTPVGTGDAVKAARTVLKDFVGDVAVLLGDAPLLTTDALHALCAKRDETKASIVVGGFTPASAAAYGRVIQSKDGQVEAIVEAKDATPEQLKVGFCNSGLMLFDAQSLWKLLDNLRNDNAKKEYYLTDCIALARQAGLTCAAVELDGENAMGINTRVELAIAERLMQRRLRERAMLNGATLLDPETVYFSADTKLGRDVVVGQNVVFGPGVEVGDNVEIRAFCHFENARVEKGALIGPFARLRPGALIGEDAHIGNFVEIKKAEISKGAKVNHLTYIGDAFVGAKANIGAGTITCNYDGFNKHRTHIGAGAFIGSDTALVAPVTVGDGAITGAGSVITKEVPANALAVARGRQMIVEGWAERFRATQVSKKK